MAEETQETAPEETPDESVETEAAVDEWNPPTREEYEKLQASVAEISDKLKRANNESASRRQKIKELEKQSETEAETAAREAREAAEAELKPAMVRALAKSALLENEARADRVGALSKLLDLSNITVENGEVVGLEDQVASLKSDYPEFFGAAKKAAPAPPVPKPEVGKRVNIEEKPKTPGEQIRDMFLGK